MALWGVDISNHQPSADLAKVKAAGGAFVFAKATEGGTFRDPYFAGFRSKAAALGLPLGAYHFARPQTGRSGADEARFFLSVVGNVASGELPCVLDLEDTKLSASQTITWALDWLRTVEAATGVRPILYTYTSFARAHLGNGAGLAAYPLWLADYRSSTTSLPSAPVPWASWAIWQHTSSASVPGVPGNADRNITNLTAEQLRALGRTGSENDMSAQDVQDINDHTNAVLLDGYTVGGQPKPSVLAVLVETQRRVTAQGAQITALTAAVQSLATANGVDPAAVKAAVTEALDQYTLTLSKGA